jgi:hypothetical protein
MFYDPILEELQQIRQKIDDECNNDFEVYYAHLLEFQKTHADRLVRFSPKPALVYPLTTGKMQSTESAD